MPRVDDEEKGGRGCRAWKMRISGRREASPIFFPKKTILVPAKRTTGTTCNFRFVVTRQFSSVKALTQGRGPRKRLKAIT